MPVAKDKVIAKLNEKFKGRSLTKDFKNNIAEKWALKIETDEDIDSYIEDREDVILEAAQDGDRRTTLAITKAKEEAAKAITGLPKEEEPKTTALPDDTPEWAKGMMAQFQAVTQKVTQMEAEKGQQTLYDRFSKQDAVKNLPKELVDKFAPKTDEEFESATQQLSSLATTLKIDAKLEQIGGDRPIGQPIGTVSTEKTATKEQLDAVMSKMSI